MYCAVYSFPRPFTVLPVLCPTVSESIFHVNIIDAFVEHLRSRSLGSINAPAISVFGRDFKIRPYSNVPARRLDQSSSNTTVMEELQKRHRQEQKDLHSRVMQKKKSATKRTRKGVNDECANLERELREQQELELSAMNGSPETEVVNIENDHEQNSEECTPNAEDLNEPRKNLHFPAAAATTDQVKKPNRQKVRLARRAAEREAAVTQAAKEASDLPDLREQERKAIRTACTSLGLKEKEIWSLLVCCGCGSTL